jgi:hypothetical protein
MGYLTLLILVKVKSMGALWWVRTRSLPARPCPGSRRHFGCLRLIDLVPYFRLAIVERVP